MKRTVLGLLIVLCATALFADYGRGRRNKGSFNKNIYVYAMYGHLNADDGWDSGYEINRGKAIFGGGFVFLRFGRQMSLGFEFDYTGRIFGERKYGTTDLDIYSYTLSFGFTLDREKKSQIFLNTGVARFSYEFGNGITQGNTAFLLAGGLKYAFNSAVAARLEARWYFDIRERNRYYDWYYDDYYYYDDDRYDWRVAGVSLSAGLEIRF